MNVYIKLGRARLPKLNTNPDTKITLLLMVTLAYDFINLIGLCAMLWHKLQEGYKRVNLKIILLLFHHL